MLTSDRNIAASFQRERTGGFYGRVIPGTPHLALVAILVFAIDFGVMAIVATFSETPDYIGAAFAALVFAGLLSPVLFFMVLRPFQRQLKERRSSEERLLMLKTAVECMSIGVTVTDLEGRIVYCNPAEADMHGYTVNELIGQEARTLSTPDRWRSLGSLEVNRMKNWKRERSNLRKDGSTFPVQLESNVVLNEKDEPIGIITNCEDITHRKEAERTLQESEARYRSLVESTEDSIYLLDREFRYIYINRKHLIRLGITQAEILGKHYGEFHSEDETNDLVDKVKYVFASGGSTQHEHRSRRDGKHFLRTLSPVMEGDNIVAVTVISKDITKLKRMEEELRTLSLTDELTGLYNRRGLMTLGEQQLKVADRFKKKILVFYADLDDMKKVNDLYGHQEGDKLLVATADIFKDVFRKSDIVARVGGDEFISMMVDVGGKEVAMIHSRLQEGIERFNSSDSRNYKLSISFGLTYYDPDVPCSLDDLLKRADGAMYELKRRKDV